MSRFKVRIDGVSLLIIASFLLDCNFLMLIPLPDVLYRVNSFVNKYLIVFIAIILVIYLYPYVKRLIKKNRSVAIYTLLLPSVLVIISVFSMIMYNESFFDTFTSWHHYLVILLAFPLTYLIDKRGSNYLAKIIIIISISYCLLSLMQEFLFLRTGNIILKGLSETDYSFRNARLRLRGANFHIIAFVIMCSRFFSAEKNNRKKILYGIGLVIELATQFLAYLTRSWWVIYISLLAIIYLITSRKKKVLRWIVLIVLACLSTQILDLGVFLESFSVNSVMGTGISTLNRLNAVKYFLGVFFKSPFIGNGFIRDARTDLHRILHGPHLTYAYSDVGIIGLLGETGVLGTALYSGFLLIVLKLYFSFQRDLKCSECDVGIVGGLFFMYVFTSPSLIATNPENIILIPISIALIYGIINKK